MNDKINNVSLMRTWLYNCHTPRGMLPKKSKPFLPTRLLDVQAFGESEDIRLVVSKDIQSTPSPRYLALSHCWGGSLPMKLEAGLVKIWSTDGISSRHLPNTFRDAVRFTRQLGIRYLWIDAMCIIQGFGGDWAHEASLMTEVYSNSYCTLAALSSKNSSVGCQVNSNIQSSLQSPFVELEAELYRSSRVRIFQKLPRPWVHEFEGTPSRLGGEVDSPLRTRAWVLQEKELSNCTIYFGKNQLLWENNRFKATAQLPWQEVKSETPSKTPRMMRETNSYQIVGAPQHTWYQLVEDYTARDLSYSSDKLVAMSGLAKAFGCETESQYLAGNWSTNLPAALLWRIDDGKAIPPPYLAPSWSWASLMGRVTYDALRLEPDHDSSQYEHPEDIYCGLKTLKIQCAQVVLKDRKNLYGDINEGRITLTGARAVKVHYDQLSVRYKDGGQPLLQHNASVGVFYQDIAAQTAGLKVVYCVAVQSESLRSLRRHHYGEKQNCCMISMVMGLVLERESKVGPYRRVGLARWLDESLFDGAQPSTIELV